MGADHAVQPSTTRPGTPLMLVVSWVGGSVMGGVGVGVARTANPQLMMKSASPSAWAFTAAATLP